MRNGSVALDEDPILVQYPTGNIGPSIMVVRVHVGQAKLILMNTHLEAGSEKAAERMTQLKFCFQYMLNEDSSEASIIFGGDLNLRDSELYEMGKVPPGIKDLWAATGYRQEFRFTWDMALNTNLAFSGSFRPRFRFDRLYLKSSSTARLKPVRFGFAGTEMVDGTRSFPSDHWAITVNFLIWVRHENRN